MSIQIYTSCNPISIGCRFYVNPGLTIPTTEGIFYDGTTCWGVDPAGYVISVESCVTSTTTTTTTAPPSTDYYNVEQYDCNNSCAFVQSLIAYSSVSRTNNIFYTPGDGYVYKVISSASGPTYDIDISSAPGNANCNIACTL